MKPHAQDKVEAPTVPRIHVGGIRDAVSSTGSRAYWFARAGWHDCLAIWRLRNHPSVRQGMRNTREFGLWQHVKWMRRTLASQTSALYVVSLRDGALAGVGRLDYTDARGEIDVYVAPHLTGRGIGKLIVNELCLEAWLHGALVCTADVKVGNEASVRLFLSCGFEQESSPDNGYLMFWKPLSYDARIGRSELW